MAGLAAACELASAGFPVTLVERRRRLGGRAGSYFDSRLGLTADLGQHVFLGCCSYYVDFLRKLGAAEGIHLQRALNLPILTKGRRPFRLRASPLPAPFHLLPSLLRLPSLSPLDRARALGALLHIRFTDRRRLVG
ncbi:MAG TPA: FAD-dependent oxidoreductase, partial [Dehalococcoidia bacterium]|nr:FAD-dependent oxidoreductase [Dehalococcoidia bacterium]